MLTLLDYFFDLCLLRRNPQDLPASRVLLRLVLFSHILVETLVIIGVISPGRALLMSLADAALLYATLVLVLFLAGRGERLLQTATALFGGFMLLMLLEIPLTQAMLLPSTDLASLAGFALLGLYIWGIIVAGHVLRHALDISLALGSLAAMLYTGLSLWFFAWLFPELG